MDSLWIVTSVQSQYPVVLQYTEVLAGNARQALDAAQWNYGVTEANVISIKLKGL